MKKITLPLLVALFSLGNVNAQETSNNYNKWSIDVNGGLTKPASPMSTGYHSDTFFSFVHGDAGVRYMFNNKFGIKADFGYDYMKNGEDSKEFRTKYYRASLQGVANLGRIMNFEEWTKVFNLQAHLGAGYSWMTPGKENVYADGLYDKDQMGHMIVGLTGQVKLAKRVALNADFSMINNFRQDRTFDGAAAAEDRAFNGTLYNATLGLSFYLGGNEEHADWFSYEDMITNRLESLEGRVTDIENKMLDSDNDGVADYLDLEPNTPAGNMVDVKGRSIDQNKNGIPDSYEQYFAENYGKGETFTKSDSNTAKDLINDGYVAVYFDFDKSTPKNSEATNFILTYLRSNPDASVEVNGFADSVGNANYNKRLSEKRAKNVAKLLEQTGVSSSRIKINAQGEDASIDGANKNVAKFARRVTFKVN